MERAEKTVEKLAKQYAEENNSAYTNDYYGFLAGFSAKEEIIKQKLKDSYNKYNSWLKEETSSKLARSPNFKRETELRAKVEVLQQLLNEKPKH